MRRLICCFSVILAGSLFVYSSAVAKSSTALGEDIIDIDFLLQDGKKKNSQKNKVTKKPRAIARSSADDIDLDSDFDLDTDENATHNSALGQSAKNTKDNPNEPQNFQIKAAEDGFGATLEAQTGGSAPGSRKIYVSGANLVNKVRQGVPFLQEELESWIMETPDINLCLDNGQTVLLYVAARYNKPEAIKLLVDNGADLQTHCTPRYEALFVAAINNTSPAVIETLINNGANMVDRDSEGNTALMLASTFNSSANVINLFIDYGLRTNSVNKYGYDALTLAAYTNNNIPILQTLLDNGTDINFRDPKGHTPLMAAVVGNNRKAAQYLIRRGADIQAKDIEGLTALDYEHKRPYLQMPDFKEDNLMSPSARLSEEFDFIARNHHHFNNALLQSVYEKDADAAVSDALKNLADIDITDENGCTTLLRAVQNNNSLSVIEKLVSANANVNATCFGGKTPLMYIAAKTNETEDSSDTINKVNYLLDHKADLNATDDEGNTALMYAVAHNANEAFIKNLLEKGADTNTTNKNQETALWLAIKQQLAPETLKILMEYGADPNTPNTKGETPLWYQLRNNGDEMITQTLLRGGADADTKNDAGDTPIWYAINHNASFVVLENIISTAQNLNVRSEQGDTPLLFAVKNDYPATLVTLLLERGANPNIRDRNGQTIKDILEKSQFFDETVKRRNREQIENW